LEHERLDHVDPRGSDCPTVADLRAQVEGLLVEREGAVEVALVLRDDAEVGEEARFHLAVTEAAADLETALEALLCLIEPPLLRRERALEVQHAAAAALVPELVEDRRRRLEPDRRALVLPL